MARFVIAGQVANVSLSREMIEKAVADCGTVVGLWYRADASRDAIENLVYYAAQLTRTLHVPVFVEADADATRVPEMTNLAIEVIVASKADAPAKQAQVFREAYKIFSDAAAKVKLLSNPGHA